MSTIFKYIGWGVIAVLGSASLLAAVFGNAGSAHADINNPHPTPPANSVTNTMLQTGIIKNSNLVETENFNASAFTATTTTENNDYPGALDVTGASTTINGVNYQWPASQGAANTVPQNDGSGNLTWQLPSATNFSSTLTFGDAVSAGEPVFEAASSSEATTTVRALGDARYVNINDASGYTQLAQKLNHNDIYTQFATTWYKVGSPTGTLTCGIQTDNAGVPSGTYLASSTFPEANIGVGATTVYFIFSNGVAASSTNTQWFTCSDTSAPDLNNYIGIGGSSSTCTSGDGNAKRYNGSWADVANPSCLDVLYNHTLVAGQVYTAGGSIYDYSNGWVGFAQSNTAAGSTGTVLHEGTISPGGTFSVGVSYYLSNTQGILATTAGTVSTKTGFALTTTKLLIHNPQ